jgi:tRNA threonylcarbamoyladenosine biosynthesis protein TsaB
LLVLALGIDTSTTQVSVVLVSWSPPPADSGAVRGAGPRVIARYEEPAANAHGEVLAPAIAQVLHDAGCARADLDVVGVGLGPGPFTGLRVGIVTASTLADALGIPAYGMCSLDTIARQHATGERDFVVVTDARRRQVYWAAYSEIGARLDGPDIATPAEVAARFGGRVPEIVGPAAGAVGSESDAFVVKAALWPAARVVAEHALHARYTGVEPTTLEPMYLRRPDARPPGPPKKVTAP